MEGFYLALGATILLPFLQWAFPTIPKLVAYAGVAGAIVLLLSEFLDPSMKPPFSAAILFLIGALCIGGSGHLYLQSLKKSVREKPTETAARPPGYNNPDRSAEKVIGGIPAKPIEPAESTPAVAPEAPASSIQPPIRPRGPVLEATNDSKINAAGAVIPNDLPFQLGKADGGSVIDMPGVVVTRKDDGTIAINTGSGSGERYFQPPTGEFADMSVGDLKARMRATVHDLNDFQANFEKDFYDPERKYPSKEKAREVRNKYSAEYREKFSKLALSLAEAALFRIGRRVDGSELSRQANDGGRIILNERFVGPAPATEAAAFLASLESRLPD
ncbi:hypothetical protein [Bradyrhizobium sp. SZCCHNRI3043]|uniref:hypothetical protein n=1 Tax=Bradyrhizobium sp. SZCCHNRI3043 TaxID=3057292 RepID=UPI0028E95D01|nr:hypothetical protein [Bradyrhizobium sp. SZCCHNRI3043]